MNCLILFNNNLFFNREREEIVKSQLSTWIRNHRACLKKQSLKKNHEGKPNTLTTAFASALYVSVIFFKFKNRFFLEIKTSHNSYTFLIRIPTESDITNAIKELNKKVVENTNMSHIKRLLKITICAKRMCSAFSWFRASHFGLLLSAGVKDA